MTALRLIIALPLAALAACVPAPAPTPAPSPSAPQPSAAPTQLVTPTYDNWMDAPQTPGNWTYASQGTATEAVFGPSPMQPYVWIRCDRASRTVSIGRASAAADAQPMTIRTETADRTLLAQPRMTAAVRSLATDLPARDPLLDAIAYSRGRFVVQVSGEPALYIPAYPEISRVIDDCR